LESTLRNKNYNNVNKNCNNVKKFLQISRYFQIKQVTSLKNGIERNIVKLLAKKERKKERKRDPRTCLWILDLKMVLLT
jgi:hypothetical protein